MIEDFMPALVSDSDPTFQNQISGQSDFASHQHIPTEFDT
jgi:hypothetical protein